MCRYNHEVSTLRKQLQKANHQILAHKADIADLKLDSFEQQLDILHLNELIDELSSQLESSHQVSDKILRTLNRIHVPEKYVHSMDNPGSHALLWVEDLKRMIRLIKEQAQNNQPSER